VVTIKRAIIIVLSLFWVILMGCGKDSKPASSNLPYDHDTAIKNGDVVNLQGSQYNVEKLEKFLDNVKKGNKDKIRITMYTTEGGAIITDLDYDGKKLNYILDTTRDGMGEQKIVKKKFDSESIYKKGSEYYLKNSPNDILIYW
jgi:hypothetical protein